MKPVGTVLVQTGFLGDLILTTPMIEVLVQRYPQEPLLVVCRQDAAALLAHDPRITQVIPFSKRPKNGSGSGDAQSSLVQQLKSKSLARAVVPHKSFRSARIVYQAQIPERIGFAGSIASLLYTQRVRESAAPHMVERRLSLLGDQRAPIKLFAPAAPGADWRWKVDPARCVIVAPGSAWETKRWNAEGFAQVAAHWSAAGYTVLVTGSKAERLVAEQVRELAVTRFAANAESILVVAGEVTLDSMLWVMSRAALVICNDSMTAHMAAAFSRPQVTVFCATTSAMGHAPYGNPLARVVELDTLWCRPCGRHGHVACPLGTMRCSYDLPARRVIEATLQVMVVEGGAVR